MKWVFVSHGNLLQMGITSASPALSWTLVAHSYLGHRLGRCRLRGLRGLQFPSQSYISFWVLVQLAYPLKVHVLLAYNILLWELHGNMEEKGRAAQICRETCHKHQAKIWLDLVQFTWLSE